MVNWTTGSMLLDPLYLPRYDLSGTVQGTARVRWSSTVPYTGEPRQYDNCTGIYISTVLYCTALHCTVLYCTVQCTVLYCTVYCTVLSCTALYCTVLSFSFLNFTVLYFIFAVLFCTIFWTYVRIKCTPTSVQVFTDVSIGNISRF